MYLSPTPPGSIPPSAACTTCPSCGSEECDVHAQLGMSCETKLAVTLAPRPADDAPPAPPSDRPPTP